MKGLLLLALLASSVGPSGTDPSLFRHTEPVRQRDPARAVVFQGRGIELVNAGKYEAAAVLFEKITTGEYVEFLTLPAYAQID